MTDRTTNTEPIDQTEPTPEATDGAQKPQDGPEAPEYGKLGAEAAKWRTRLREAEAERDLLAARLDQSRRQVVEAAAGRRLYKPEALWVAGIDPASLFAEDGTLDHDRLAAAVEDAATKLGLNSIPRPDPSQGVRASTRAARDFSDAFRPTH